MAEPTSMPPNMSSAETSSWIRSLRGPKPDLDAWKPSAFEVEDELARSGSVDPTGTVFITNRECPFTCLMCDLWQYTTDESVPLGAVDAQVEHALALMPDIRHVKLYNAGNFFDDKAITPEDRAAIAARVGGYETVVLENHPKLIDERVAAWRDEAGTTVDVAMGLETVNPDVLPRLNKRMTLGDFEAATTRLLADDINVRAFVLVRAPFMSEAEGVEWACRSVEWAFSVGVECCAVIPTRAGNGALDSLAASGDFASPKLTSLEEVLDHCVGLGQGRVFADLWDVGLISGCPECATARIKRLRALNLSQKVTGRVVCACGT
jgi:archaeosine synthase beta-subunit